MPESAASGRLVRFGLFEFDLHTGELRKSGLKLHLEGQPVEALRMLVERPGELLTREELQKKLWPADTFVDFEHGLNAAINKLREALGDDADNPRFVETLPRRGYRFIAPVEPLTPGPSPPGRGERGFEIRPSFEGSGEGVFETKPSLLGRGWAVAGGPGEGTVAGRRGDSSPASSSSVAPVSSPAKTAAMRTSPLQKRVALAAGALAVVVIAVLGINLANLRDRLFRTVAAVSDRRSAMGTSPLQKIESIAVLPLENLSGDPEQEYFADGMTEELITNLGKIGSLRVISRTSVMRFKGARPAGGLAEIAQMLNVDAIVEGSVMRSGDRVRITANLIGARSERHLWAESYERDLRDVLALQGEIASAIASEIRIKLTPQQQARLGRPRPVNPQAHDAYLRGRHFWNLRGGEHLRKGLEYFEQAVSFDPNYGEAYAGIADSYSMLVWYGPLPSTMAYPKAMAAATKAIELDDSLAEAHTSLGEVLFNYEWNWSAAENAFRRAIELNPGYAIAHHCYSWFLVRMGRHDEGLAEIKRAQALDPLSVAINTNVGSALFHRAEYDAAIEQLQKALELDPDFQSARFWLGHAYREKGLHKEGLRELESAVKLSDGNAGFLGFLGYHNAVTGRRDEAHRILAGLKEQSKKGYVPPWSFAVLHAGLGEKDQTIKYLEKAFQERNFGITHLNQFRETFFRSMRSDPRFQDLLQRMNFPD